MEITSHEVTSHGDVESLSKNDPEITKLRDRLKEQSSLIALLTEQADRNASLLAAPSLREDYEHEHQRAESLSQRFDELAERFQQLTQIKDSYKEQIRSFEVVLRQNAERQQAAVKPLLQAKDEQIDNLKKKIKDLEREKTEFLAHQGLLEYGKEELGKELEQKNVEFGDLLTRYQEIAAKNHQLELQLNDAWMKMQKTGELNQIVAQRGVLLVAKDKTIAELKEEVLQWRQRLMDAVRKYHEKTAETDADCKVKVLNTEIFRLQKTCALLERKMEAVQKIAEKSRDSQKAFADGLINAHGIGDLLRLYQK